MTLDLVNPFVEGTLQMMGMMLGLDCEVCEIERPPFEASSVYGVVHLTGMTQGRLAVAMNDTDGRRVVAAMLGLDDADVDGEMMHDGVGEMANVIAGFAKSELADLEHDFEMSLPQIETASPALHHERSIFRSFACELGSVLIGVELTMAPTIEMTEKEP